MGDDALKREPPGLIERWPGLGVRTIEGGWPGSDSAADEGWVRTTEGGWRGDGATGEGEDEHN